MKKEQIYELVNNLNDMTTTGIAEVVDHSTFISFGETVLTTDGLKDVVYNKLIDVVGKVVIAIDEYRKQKRYISVDSFEFGALLTKISYSLQDAEENSDWKFPTGNNPYEIEPKSGVIQKVYKRNLGVFEYNDVAMTRQLNSAFRSEEEFGGFVDGLYTRMRNARELALENLENVTVGALALETIGEVENASRRVRHLLTEYKVLNPDSDLTSATCKTDSDFLTFVVTAMYNELPFLNKYTAMYNDGTVERRTTSNDLVVEMISQFSNYIDVYLKSNTYHDNLIKLPQFVEVPYWENPSTPYKIEHTLNADTEEEEVLSQDNIIAIYRDKNACACTMQYERTISKYDEWNDRVPFKMTAERNYMVDTSENVIVWLCD